MVDWAAPALVPAPRVAPPPFCRCGRCPHNVTPHVCCRDEPWVQKSPADDCVTQTQRFAAHLADDSGRLSKAGMWTRLRMRMHTRTRACL
jgi:hypothetical protein